MFWKSAPKPSANPSAPAGADNGALHVSITDTAPCQKSVRLRLGREMIAPMRATVVAEFQHAARLPGFRKGKAPTDLVERQYAQDIQSELLHRLTKQALEEAAKTHQLKPVSPFELKRADLSETDGFTLEASVEVEPAFPLAAYKGLPLAKPSLEVTPAEIERALVSLQESMAQLVPVGAGGAKERQVPPIDHELAKDAGFETVDQLKAHVEATVRDQKRAAQAQQMEAALCEELLKRHPFEVPPRLVERQAERITREFTVRLLLAGTPQDAVETETAKFAQQLRESASRRVRLAFILDRIAEQEAVTVTEDELVGRLWQMAQRWKKDPAQVRKIFDAQGLWPSVVSAIRQDKTMALLLGAATVSEPIPSTKQSVSR